MIEEDRTKGVAYVYVRFPDRVDVYKFTFAEIVAAHHFGHGGEALIRDSVPRYRVQDGECDCEGYKYRSDCRHETRVRGWLRAGE